MRIGRIITGGAIVAVLAAVPWVDGVLFKRNYYHFVQALAMDKAVDIKITEYQEGWLRSTAKVSITPKRMLASHAALGTQETPYTTPTIILDQSISHGPIAYDAGNRHWVVALATIRSNIHLPAAMEAILLGTQANSDGVVESNAVATLKGDYISQIKTPVFNMSIPDVNIVWQGVHGSMNFEMHGHRLKKVTTEMTIGALSANGKGMAVTTEEAQLKYNMSPDVSGLWNGSYSITFPAFSLTNANTSYQAKDLTLAYLFGAVTPGLYSVNLQFSANQLSLPNKWEITQLRNDTAFENVSTPGLANFVKTVNSFKENPNPVTPEQYQQQMLTLLPSLITNTTLFKESMTMNTSYGAASLNAQAAWPDAIKDAQEILKKTKATMDIRVAVTLADQLITSFTPQSSDPAQGPSTAEQMKQQMAALIQRGMVTQDKSDYVTTITMEEGVVKANGVEVQRVP